MTDLEFQVNTFVSQLLSELDTHYSIVAILPSNEVKSMIATKIPIAAYHRIQCVVTHNENAVVRTFKQPEMDKIPHGKDSNNGEKEE